MRTKGKPGPSQERSLVRGDAPGPDHFSTFMKKKSLLGVPNWGWGIILASVGLFHISK
jgi:hypothetical protein